MNCRFRSSAFLFVSTRSFSISTQRQKEIVDLNEVNDFVQKEIVDLNEVIAQEANQSLGSTCVQKTHENKLYIKLVYFQGQNAAETLSKIAATDPSFAEIGLNKLSVPTGWQSDQI